MSIKDDFTLRTVRKKIIMVSKIAGMILIISYIISTRLPVDPDLSFWIWLCFVMMMVLVINYLMGRFISRPVSRLNQAARQMAQLDFSAPCNVNTNDEFGELSQNLNKMSQNLQQTLLQLQTANSQMEKDIEQKKRLLTERKELVDSLSHEMKTPLGIIRAYAEGLQDEGDETKRQKYAEVIVTETERLNVLITTLLDLSALENGASQLQPERFDFVEFLETVAGRLLIDTPEADFELQYELPEQAVYVNADRGRMEQVLDNLIVNAKRNVNPGGVLKVSLKENDGALDFSIFNQGPPIPQENLSKIWTKYELPEQAVYVNADRGRMEQVLDNLIVNAKRNVNPGGVLKVSLKENDGALDFSIFNQGPPIPQENLSKIWTKFYRDRNSKYSGSGLGLAIVAQILSMQNLPYGVSNQPDGVVFYFSVPCVSNS